MLLFVAIAAGVGYQVNESKYKTLLTDKDAAIALKDSKIAELQKAKPVTAVEGKKTAAAATTVTSAGTKIVCTLCHDLKQTKGFHYVENIKLLDEGEGKTPRICTTCHGSVPHNIHQKKLAAGEMKCETCHVSPEGDFKIPQVPKGKLLVCEGCHAFSGKPEDVGNYIAIHIEEGSKTCGTCHMGNPVRIHKDATEKLGLVDGKIYTTVSK